MSALRRLRPDWLAAVSRQSWRADTSAGLLGAVLVLPQAIAFATLAGLPPQYGLYSAIVPCIVAALFGSSWHVVTGPTNANSLALFAMLAPLAAVGSGAYIELALAVTVLVGVLQLATGALRLGSIANFISPTALLGFTSGAALLITIHALKETLGLALPAGLHAAAVLQAVLAQLGQVHAGALAVALATGVSALLLRRWRRQWPYMLAGVVVGSAVAWLVNHSGNLRPVRVLGALASPIPPWHPPNMAWQQLPELLAIAAALTVVALAQSIAIAKAVADRSGQRIDGNREFIGQGLANVVGGLFSCYVACGSLNRSLPNLEAGARTPLAAVTSGLLVIPLVALSAPLLALIPYAAIAALLMLVAWSLLDLPRWRQLLRASRAEFGVALLTLVATLTLRLELAVLIGSALSLGLFLQRTARPAMRTMGFDSTAPTRQFVVRDDTPAALPECPQFKLLRMEGSVYFGATAFVADHLQALRNQARPQQHLLVMAKSMNFVDVSGSELWRHELQARRAMGGDLYFHRPRPPVLAQWRQDGMLEALGADHIFPDKRSAIRAICQRLDRSVCAACRLRVFEECSDATLVAPLHDQAPAGGASAAPPADRAA
jgi:sulfate permease, SulP family